MLVNAIAPGVIGTTGTPLLSEEPADHERLHPLGVGGTEPICNAVLYLLGPGGNWVSGAVFNISRSLAGTMSDWKAT